MPTAPVQTVWDEFWQRKRDLDKVYASSPVTLKAILSHVDVAGKQVLEVGAGTGRDSAELARRGAEVFVLDLSPASLEIIAGLRHDLGLSNLHLVRGNALRLPFADGAFDFVFHQGLLEHFREPEYLLKENRRVLRPGGYCLCSVPQTIHLFTLVKKILIAMDRWFAGWETQYTLGSLKRLMGSAGFEVVHCYGDWMRPCFLYRVIREMLLKTGIELPRYPFVGTRYQIWKDALLDRLGSQAWAHYTQVGVGVLARRL